MIAEKRKLFLVSSFFPLYKELCISIVILAAAAAVALARELFYAGMQNLPHNSICVKDPPYGRGPVQCHGTSIWVYCMYHISSRIGHAHAACIVQGWCTFVRPSCQLCIPRLHKTGCSAEAALVLHVLKLS